MNVKTILDTVLSRVPVRGFIKLGEVEIAATITIEADRDCFHCDMVRPLSTIEAPHQGAGSEVSSDTIRFR